MLLKDAEMCPEKFRRPDYREYLRGGCAPCPLVSATAPRRPTSPTTSSELQLETMSAISAKCHTTVANNTSDPLSNVFNKHLPADDIADSSHDRHSTCKEVGVNGNVCVVQNEGSDHHLSQSVSEEVSGSSGEVRRNVSIMSLHGRRGLDHGDCPPPDFDTVSLASTDSRMLAEYGIGLLSDDEKSAPYLTTLSREQPSFNFLGMCDDSINEFRTTVCGAANPSPRPSYHENKSAHLESDISDDQLDILPWRSSDASKLKGRSLINIF